MRLYLVPVICICFVVDGLLLLAANKMTHGPGKPMGILLAAQLGALYAAACVRFDLSVAETLWGRLVVLAVSGVVAYGVSPRGLQTAFTALLLSVAASVLAGAMGGEKGDLVVAAMAVALLCGLLLQKNGMRQSVPVSLCHGGVRVQLTALRDTGNTLRDPLTGEQVLVLDADAAKKLLGLGLQQLQDPVGTLAQTKITGLRLIPYRTISHRGLLLGIRIADAQIGKERRSTVVAFAPEQFSSGNGFQALMGGAI